MLAFFYFSAFVASIFNEINSIEYGWYVASGLFFTIWLREVKGD